MGTLAEQERYEEAAAWRDRLAALLRGVDVTTTSDLLGRTRQIVAARATDDLGWEVHVIRHGRLAVAGRIAPGVDPIGPLEALLAAAEDVPPPSTRDRRAAGGDSGAGRVAVLPRRATGQRGRPGPGHAPAGGSRPPGSVDVDLRDPVPLGLVRKGGEAPAGAPPRSGSVLGGSRSPPRPSTRPRPPRRARRRCGAGPQRSPRLWAPARCRRRRTRRAHGARLRHPGWPRRSRRRPRAARAARCRSST